jgi:hypothetical protein
MKRVRSTAARPQDVGEGSEPLQLIERGCETQQEQAVQTDHCPKETISPGAKPGDDTKRDRNRR